MLADPARLVPILARGLAAFHAAAPVDACPFDFRVDNARSRTRADGSAIGIAKPTDLHPEHAHLTLDAALAELERLAPESEDLVVCHGDYCFPNVLLDERGAITGYVDLGELGVADRWWDIAIGAWSTTWNIGPGWEELFYESYGIEPDARAHPRSTACSTTSLRRRHHGARETAAATGLSHLRGRLPA